MGKAKKIKKKMHENQEAKHISERKAKQEELEVSIRQFMEEEEYAKVLDVLAEMIQIKDIQPEFLYDGAYAYFMLGDYERAAQWVSNVLTYDNTNLEARTLLARICIVEDRVEDGLSIYEFVLKTRKGHLSEEMQNEIEDIVSYYVRQNPEKISREYPNIAAFMEVQRKMLSDEKKGEDNPAAGSSPKEILQALKDRVVGNQEKDPSRTLPEKPMEKASREAALVNGGGAREILQALRDKVLHENTGAGNAEKKMDQETAAAAKQQEIIEAQPLTNVQSSEDDVKQKIQAIAQQKISLVEKVRILNAYAGECYYRKDLAGAKALLTEALYIDSVDCMTVKNMAYVLLEQGEKEKALQLVVQAKVKDFALIRLLRNE